jgi:linoleoyl-CoA desaturase
MDVKTQVKFTGSAKNEFFPVVRKRVDEYFNQNQISKHANATMIIKSIVLLSAYLLPFIFIVVNNPPFVFALLIWAFMGAALAGIGMSVMHDANHGAYSSNSVVNYIMGHTLNLLGGAVFNWKLQHNLLHHTYTNISGMDEDIQSRGALRFSPHTKMKGIHRFQPFYAVFFYGMMTLYWVLAKDVVQFFKYTRNGVNKNSRSQNVLTLSLIISNKLIYIALMIAIPAIYFGLALYQILLGLVVMHFIAALILSFVFQLAHTVEGTSHPLPDEKGNIQNEWAIHQMNTTVNFARHNKLISWYVGGLNYQVEHHLFPRICHVHYPKIADIVKETAEEFSVPYLENKTFFTALRSHFSTLKRLGRLPDMNEVLA